MECDRQVKNLVAKFRLREGESYNNRSCTAGCRRELRPPSSLKRSAGQRAPRVERCHCYNNKTGEKARRRLFVSHMLFLTSKIKKMQSKEKRRKGVPRLDNVDAVDFFL